MLIIYNARSVSIIKFAVTLRASVVSLILSAKSMLDGHICFLRKEMSGQRCRICSAVWEGAPQGHLGDSPILNLAYIC